jgi:hypothetical protein
MGRQIETQLQNALSDHYVCFMSQRFWVDQYNHDYVAICNSVRDPSPPTLCTNIARFVKKWLIENDREKDLIFVGPYVWKWEKL